MFLRSLAGLAILSFSLSVHASAIWHFEVLDPAPIVTPHETITITLKITNDAASPETLFGSSLGLGYFGGVAAPYFFDFNLFFFEDFQFAVLAPGESSDFFFGTLTPDAGGIPPGFYDSIQIGIGFYDYTDGEEKLVEQYVDYSITVVDGQTQSVPEPSIALLFLTSVACAGIFIKRR